MIETTNGLFSDSGDLVKTYKLDPLAVCLYESALMDAWLTATNKDYRTRYNRSESKPVYCARVPRWIRECHRCGGIVEFNQCRCTIEDTSAIKLYVGADPLWRINYYQIYVYHVKDCVINPDGSIRYIG